MSHPARVLFDGAINTCYTTMTVTSPEGGGELEMEEGTYRVRYCVNEYRSEDRGHARDYPGEKYLLIFWPEAERRQDAVIKQTWARFSHTQRLAAGRIA